MTAGTIIVLAIVGSIALAFALLAGRDLAVTAWRAWRTRPRRFRAKDGTLYEVSRGGALRRLTTRHGRHVRRTAG